MSSRSSVPSSRTRAAGFGTMFLLLCAVLSVLLYRSFLPGSVQFANDGPFGRISSACHRLPDRFTGVWEDLNSIGFRGGAAPPNISFALQYLLQPEFFAKFYALIALLILGLAAWCFLRQSGLSPPACLLGGLAAALNSCFFSNACWGVAAQQLTIALNLLALAALLDTTSKLRWLRVVLAGLAVGMGVSEGDDIGAIFSLFVAAFIMYRACVAEGARVKNIAVGLLRVTLVAVCAGWLAAQAVSELVATNIEGVAGMEQDEKTREGHWDWATQWSLPKREILGLIAPGLFGNRLDSPEGGNYWGATGQAAAWQKYFDSGNQGTPPARGFKRYTGGGNYAGMLVVLTALWAALQGLRRKDSVFLPEQRKMLWFWSGLCVVSILLAFGRWAPFYRLLYALPYFSTMRNPTKFLYFVSLALVVLFAYGIDGLRRKYMQPAPGGAGARWAGVKSWWAKAGKFEKGWVRGWGLAIGLCVIGWAAYASSREALLRYLIKVQFNENVAPLIADFSIRQVGWALLFLVLAGGLIVLIYSGAFAGPRSRRGAVLLGVLLVVDLGRANLPWIIHWDIDDKYASNPVIEALRDKPYEHRVALAALPPVAAAPRHFYDILSQVYRVEWLQHLLPYQNIQALDNVMMPRKQEDLLAYEQAFVPQSVSNTPASLPLLIRRWQLTNTRYLVGVAGLENILNRESSVPLFREVQRFDFVAKPGVAKAEHAEELTARPSPNGSAALLEFTGALPRAKLYANWQLITNRPAALKQLTNRAFDPEHTVLVAETVPATPASADTNQNAGSVEITSYAPKHVVLQSEVRMPAILLLNDRHDPSWKVQVDGQPAPLLLCNYIMQGVYLLPGNHVIDFRFQPPFRLLYVSLSAVCTGLVLLGIVLVPARRPKGEARAPATQPPVAQSPPAPAPTPRPRGKNGRRPATGARRN